MDNRSEAACERLRTETKKKEGIKLIRLTLSVKKGHRHETVDTRTQMSLDMFLLLTDCFSLSSVTHLVD